MLGKIISIKNYVVYLQLSINIYQVDNLIGKNVTFDNRYIGEVLSVSNNMLEITIIGEIVNEYVYQESYWNGHYPSNSVSINVLYNKLTPKTELLFQKPVAMEAGLYNNKPVIKAKFHLHSVTIK